VWADELAAGELPNLPPEDALQLVHLYAERGSPKYEKAALRWLERPGRGHRLGPLCARDQDPVDRVLRRSEGEGNAPPPRRSTREMRPLRSA
jgi:hypothetical protein